MELKKKAKLVITISRIHAALDCQGLFTRPFSGCVFLIRSASPRARLFCFGDDGSPKHVIVLSNYFQVCLMLLGRFGTTYIQRLSFPPIRPPGYYMPGANAVDYFAPPLLTKSTSQCGFSMREAFKCKTH